MHTNKFIISTVDSSMELLTPIVDYITEFTYSPDKQRVGTWGYSKDIKDAHVFDDMAIGIRLREWHADLSWANHDTVFIRHYDVRELFDDLMLL